MGIMPYETTYEIWSDNYFITEIEISISISKDMYGELILDSIDVLVPHKRSWTTVKLPEEFQKGVEKYVGEIWGEIENYAENADNWG